MNTSFITLTDLWHNGKYVEVGDIIRAEQWNAGKVAEFCLYFVKYVGLKEFEVLYKFL
jgi:hypothetical protein